MTCYTLWNGWNSYAKKYRVLKAFVHPCWRGSPATGFDYGVGILGAEEDGDLALSADEINDDYFTAQVSQETERIIKGAMGHVAGYPGSWGETMCEMSGQFQNVEVTRRGQYTGHCISYNID